LTTAMREAGVTVTEDFVADLLAAGAPHVTRRHRALAQPSRVLEWWRSQAASRVTRAAPSGHE
jgi:hypothetical protein